MGLDVVELVMAWEEAFDVAIPDEGAEHLRTLGDVVHFIREQLAPPASGACATQLSFHLLRRGLVAQGTRRRSVRLEAPVAYLMPEEDWRAGWKDLEERVGLALPRPAVTTSNARASTAAAFAAGALASRVCGPGAGLAVAATVLSLGYLYGPLMPAPEAATVRDLCQSVTALNYGKLVERGARWRDAEALDVVRGVAAEQMGVPIERLWANTPIDPERWD